MENAWTFIFTAGDGVSDVAGLIWKISGFFRGI
jgi:hypothetical protein